MKRSFSPIWHLSVLLIALLLAVPAAAVPPKQPGLKKVPTLVDCPPDATCVDPAGNTLIRGNQEVVGSVSIGGAALPATAIDAMFNPKNISAKFPEVTWYFTIQYTMGAGNHIVFNDTASGVNGPGRIYRFTSDYSSYVAGSLYDRPPYSVAGISQNPKTTAICYGEYTLDTDTTASIWRSTNGTGYAKVLTVDALGGASPVVRHFHTVSADPGDNLIWYASSGDLDVQSHIWKSTDDGATWTMIQTGSLNYNTLNFQYDDDYVYWCSDSINGGCFKMDKTTDVVTELIAPSTLSGLCYTLIETPYGFVGVYLKNVSALDPDNSYLYLIQKDGAYQELFKGPFNMSIASLKSGPISGNFYIHSSDHPTGARILRGKIVYLPATATYAVDLQPINLRPRAAQLTGASADYNYQAYFMEHKMRNGGFGRIAEEDFYVYHRFSNIFHTRDGINFYHAPDTYRIK